MAEAHEAFVCLAACRLDVFYSVAVFACLPSFHSPLCKRVNYTLSSASVSLSLSLFCLSLTYIHKYTNMHAQTNQLGTMPSPVRMKKDGREDLAILVEKYGGHRELARKMDMRVRVEANNSRVV